MAANKKNVLISLVSDQTLPNVELILEFESFIEHHIFVYTKEKKEQFQWILQATKVKSYEELVIDAFNIEEIEKELRSYPFQDNEYFLNITGGTKIMILAFQEFFKSLGAKIYYLTGKNGEYLKIFPVLGERRLTLHRQITLEEYLLAYGFKFKKGNPLHNAETADRILNYFLNNDVTRFDDVIDQLREKRKKGTTFQENDDIHKFISTIGYKCNSPLKLDSKDVKYLTGEWFEEYVYFKLKEELNLEENQIGTGYKLEKKGTPNEIDVLFVYKNKLFIIECKTSVIDKRFLPDGTINKFKLLPEIIYKSDALRGKFGLFADTSILTLEEIKNEDGSPIQGYETHFKRAELSRIKIISKRDFNSRKPLKELLNISPNN